MAHRRAHRRSRPIAALALAAAVAAAPCTAAATEVSSIRARTGSLYDFTGIDAQSVAITLEPDDWPTLFRRDGDMHYDVGLLRVPDVDRGHDLYGVNFSAAWQFHPEIVSPWVFFELGIGVTWLSGQHILARDLGSRGHFAPHALLGFRPGAGSPWHIGLRARHTSNAGLADPNPGFDIVQFEVGYRFGGD